MDRVSSAEAVEADDEGALRLPRLLLPSWRMAVLGIVLSLSPFWQISDCSRSRAGSSPRWRSRDRSARRWSTPAGGRGARRWPWSARAGATRSGWSTTTRRCASSLAPAVVFPWHRAPGPRAPCRPPERRPPARIRADVDTLDDYYVRGVVPVHRRAARGALHRAVLVALRPRGSPGSTCRVWPRAAVPFPSCCQLAARREAARRASAELRASIVEEVEGMAELVVLGAVHEREARLEARGRDLDRHQRRLAALREWGRRGWSPRAPVAVWAAAGSSRRWCSRARAGPDLAMLTVFVLASFEASCRCPR